MSATDGSDAFGPDVSEARAPEARDVPSFLSDESRVRAYLAVAALVEAGLPLAQAGSALADAYRARGQAASARAVASFFGEAGNFSSPAAAASAALDAFGDTFVTPEEEAVIGALALGRGAAGDAAALRAAAALIPLKAKGHAVARPAARGGAR